MKILEVGKYVLYVLSNFGQKWGSSEVLLT